MNARAAGGLPALTNVQAAFAGFPSGVAALCAYVGTERVGMVVSSFSVGVSFDPPLVLFSIQNSSSTWPKLQKAETIGVSILGHTHDAVCRQLSSRYRDRFEGVDVIETDGDALFIDQSSAWFECVVRSEVPAGDHAIVVMEVLATRLEPMIEPLIYHGTGFRKLEGISGTRA